MTYQFNNTPHAEHRTLKKPMTIDGSLEYVDYCLDCDEVAE